MSQVIAAIGFGLVTASILSIASVGFTLQFGVTNVLNIAYGSVMISCAFVAYYFTTIGVPLILAAALGTAFGAVLSVLMNRVVYTPFIKRGTRLFGMIIVTISMGLIIQNAILCIVGPTFVALPVGSGAVRRLGSIVLTDSQLVVIGIAIAAMLGVHVVLKYTPLGKSMRAAASNAALARASGISVARVSDVAWGMSGALCGLAGVVLALNTASFQYTTGDEFLVVIIAAAVLGGIGYPYGAVIGSAIIGIGMEVASIAVGSSYKEIFAFAILVLVLLLRPQGIFADIAGRREVAA
ncbi:MAG TPA: branched-chain amino acid ABC transporter permease [Candidatus Dormibacteraeota bacterium]|jgi:branched-chain amino acid transport system permease protein/neutral amino acid transport system permease protein